VPLFLLAINESSIFSAVFEENPQIPNLIKIHPVGDEMLHADGRADRHKEVVRQFCERA